MIGKTGVRLECPRCGESIPSWQPVHLGCFIYRIRAVVWILVASVAIPGGVYAFRVASMAYDSSNAAVSHIRTLADEQPAMTNRPARTRSAEISAPKGSAAQQSPSPTRMAVQQTKKDEALKISPGVSPPNLAGHSKQQLDESRCKELIEAGRNSLNQKPNSDYERALLLAKQAQAILPDCPGAAELLKQASSQREFFVAERLRKEREDSVNRDRCLTQINLGRQALQAGRYDQALRYVNNARGVFAQCPEADSLEQEANAAQSTVSKQADTEKRSKCEALVNMGNDAFLRRDYRAALSKAAQAKRIYPGCAGADELQNRTSEAVCTSYLVDGQEAMRAGRYSQAVNAAKRAIGTFARCPGAEQLEQEALLAMNADKEKHDQEKQEKSRARCEALIAEARDALQSNRYDEAINRSRRAKQAFAQCAEAGVIEREAVEAKRKAREGTSIF